MKDYEVIYILSPNLEDEVIAGFIEKFENIIRSSSGEIQSTDKIGRKKLAYEIKGNKDGYYIIMRFKAMNETVTELGRILKIQDEVLRYIIVEAVKGPEAVKGQKEAKHEAPAQT